MTTKHRFTLPNGLRVVLEPMADRTSTAIQFVSARGSRHESPQESGITHFVEHLLFKGTARRDLYAIAREMNLHGGGMNAGTGYDNVGLSNRVVAEDLPEALDLMADMMWGSTFPEVEVERERGVILEEIAEALDNPDDLCFELFMEAMYSPHALGRNILGTEDSVSGFSQRNLLDFWRRLVHPENLILSLAGGFEAEPTEALIRRMFSVPADGPRPDGPDGTALGQERRRAESRDLEQVQFCFGVPAISRTDERRFGLALFDTILGGGMGSRLFNEIREKRGLVYTIASSATTLAREGYLAIYGSSSPENMDQILSVTRGEIADLCDNGPTEEELETAKRQVLRSYIMSLESPGFRASRNVDREQYQERDLSDAEVIARIREVSREELRKLARDLFSSRQLTMSFVGPLPEAASGEVA